MVRGKLPSVGDTEVGGVKGAERHILDKEAAALANMCKRVGRRLRRWLVEMPEHVPWMRMVGTDENGRPIVQQVLHPDTGEPMMEPFVPPEDWRENFKWYSQSVLKLLAEQRERAKLAGRIGGPPLSDEEYETEIADLKREALSVLTPAELERELQSRTAPQTDSQIDSVERPKTREDI